MNDNDHIITTSSCVQDNDNVCNNMNNNTHYYYDRFIPCSNDISIETDVPGYYNNNYVDNNNSNDNNKHNNNNSNDNSDHMGNSTITTTTKRTLIQQEQSQQQQQGNNNGPICWKCHGIGIIHKKKTKNKKKKNDESCTNDINNNNDNNDNNDNDNNDMNSCCPICHGIGRIIIPKNKEQQHNNKQMNEIFQLIEQYNNNNYPDHHRISSSSSSSSSSNLKTSDKQQQWLMVTKGRRHDPQHHKLRKNLHNNDDNHDDSNNIDEDDNNNHNDNNNIDPKPYGYSVPIYGKQIQYDATQQYHDFIIPLKQQHNIIEEEGTSEQSISECTESAKTTKSSLSSSLSDVLPLWLQPLKSKNETSIVNDKDMTNNDNNNTDDDIIIIQLCNLVGEYRILQKFASHRYTTDDMMTAYVASKILYNHYHHSQQQQKQQHMNGKTNDNNSDTDKKYHYLDLGTGNGSVMLMVLWSSIQMKKKYHHITHRSSSNNMKRDDEHDDDNSSIITNVIGIEARYEAIQLARRSIEFNLGPQPKLNIQIIHSDFRSYFLDREFTDNDNKSSRTNSNNSSTYNSNSCIDNSLPSFDHKAQHQSDDDDNHIHSISHDNNNNKTMKKDVVLYDLITGTPPYFRVEFEMMTTTNEEHKQLDDVPILDNSNNIQMNASNTKIKSATIRQGGMPIKSIQSAPARCEFRGGIEAYCYIASLMLKPNVGRFIVCNNYLNHNRSLQAFTMYHLLLHQIYYIHGKKNKPILFCVYIASKPLYIMSTSKTDEDVVPSNDISQQQKHDDGNDHSSEWKQSTTFEEISISVRDENGHYTTEYKEQVLHHFSIYPPPNT